MRVSIRFSTAVALLAICVVFTSARAEQNTPAAPAQTPARLLNPAQLTERAPETYRVLFDTTVGIFVVRVTRAWAPNGADRFNNLVKAGYYDENRFFRVVKDFVAQWGIHGDPAVSAAWEHATIPVDRALVSNTRGRVTFAQGNLASSRTTQVFINLKDNSRLDISSFAPIGEVVTSMIMVERLYAEYGEGVDQGAILAGGNAWLARALPRLDYIKRATIEQ